VPTPAAQRYGPRETALLLLLAAVWGLSFLFIELALETVTPLWIVGGRTAFGALVLLAALRLRRARFPGSIRLWWRLAILGFASNAVPWGAVAWAQQTIPSGLTALLMAVVPTSTLLVSAAVGAERLTPTRVAGLLLALGGVGAIVAGDLSDSGRLLAVAAVLVATLLYAAGAVFAKHAVSGREAPLVIAFGQVTAAFVVTIPVALAVDGVPDLTAIDVTGWAALVALGAAGTGGAFLVFYTLIERVGATNTTMVTYLIPLVAVAAGAVVLGERLELTALVGGALIGGGIWLAQRGVGVATQPGTAETTPIASVGAHNDPSPGP
jgi:drug/metabolite transporter (DMT)-like permease